MTFTYNLNKATLETLLSGTESASAKQAVEAALHVSGLGAGTILTTYVDTGWPHVFNASTTGFSNFTTSGQLLIADALGLGGGLPSIFVTDSAGGNVFATGIHPDKLTINNLSMLRDTVYGSGTGEQIYLGLGSFLAGAGATGASTIVAGTDSASHFHNELWGGQSGATNELWGGGLTEIFANNATATLNAGRWSTSADTIHTGAGHDTVNTWNGNDLIYGYNVDSNGGRWADGSNTIFTGSGSDTIFAGTNSAIYGVNDTVHPGTGVTEIFGSDQASAHDTIVAYMNDMYIGGGDGGWKGSMSIEGGSGRLFVWNGAGNETIKLGSGTDTINLVNTGSSSIVGGTGFDTINYWSSQSDATIIGGAHTTLNLVDTTLPGAGTSNADGTTTYNFGAHTLTVGGQVSIVSGQAADLTSFAQFKNPSV